MKFPFRRTLALPFVAFALACGGDSPTGPNGNTQASLKLVNHSPNAVLFVRTRPCGGTNWGSDLLGTEVLSTNETLTAQVAPGCLDVRFTPAESGVDYVYFMGVNAQAGVTTTLAVDEFPPE